MVVRRFLAVFYPAAEYLQTTRITRVDEHHFKTEGKVLQNQLARVYGRVGGEDNENLPPIAKDEKVGVLEVARTPVRPSRRRATTRPRCFGNGGGRQAGRGRRVARGNGSEGPRNPATRAAIIEGLIYEDYIHPKAGAGADPEAFSLLFALARDEHPGACLTGAHRRMGATS